MEKKVNERLGNELIRRFYGLETRPVVKEATDAVMKKLMSVDSTRETKDKEEPLDQPLK
jgi:hypothetical protein